MDDKSSGILLDQLGASLLSLGKVSHRVTYPHCWSDFTSPDAFQGRTWIPLPYFLMGDMPKVAAKCPIHTNNKNSMTFPRPGLGLYPALSPEPCLCVIPNELDATVSEVPLRRQACSAGVIWPCCLLGSRKPSLLATTAGYSCMKNYLLSTNVRCVPVPVTKPDEASVSWNSQWGW